LTGLQEKLNSAICTISPTWALRRRAAQFAYDALATDRTRSGRRASGKITAAGGLTDADLETLRDTAIDLSMNNPLVEGILLTEADDVVGTETQIQARSEDEGWNRETEAAFKAECIDQPCDNTGRWNYHQIVHKAFHSYRSHGDFFLIRTPYGPQCVEANRCGTPIDQRGTKEEGITVIHGVAVSDTTEQVVGYYIGKPNKWGYIAVDKWKKYPVFETDGIKQWRADVIHHVFNPQRVSFTRGIPALTSAVTTIYKLFGYIDAELVAAKVHACLSLFIQVSDNNRVPSPFTQGRFSGGQTDLHQKVEKLEPGMIKYLNLNEEIKPVTPNRPANAFDMFVMRMLMFIGRPLCMPLVLTALDFAQATYMNMRGALQQAQKNYKREQEHVVKPLASTCYRWWLRQAIAAKRIKEIKTAYRHEVMCQRWPYVDPYKQAMADKIELDNGTELRSRILARKGIDPGEFYEQQEKERKRNSKSTPQEAA